MKQDLLRNALLAVAASVVTLGTVFAAPPVESVGQVDLQRYSGTWYELARRPNRFQEHCEGDVTASYQPLKDGSIEVLNRCRQKNDKWEESHGRAVKASGSDSGAKLKVSFLPNWLRWVPMGRGDYWVVMLDPDYRFAVVSEPSREYLWVLSRTPTLDAAEYDGIIGSLRTQGYPVDRLVRTPQTPPAAAAAAATPRRMI